jgi:anti-anti-sigma factor
MCFAGVHRSNTELPTREDEVEPNVIDVEGMPGVHSRVLRLDGDFDGLSVPGLRDSLNVGLNQGVTQFVLDLTDCEYMDSSGLGFIIWADHRLAPVSGRLAITGQNPDVTRILELSGLIVMAPSVTLAPSMEQALVAADHTPDTDETPLWCETFDFPSDARQLSEARKRVADLLTPLGMPDAAVFDLKVAVGEALANAVRHGSPQGSGDVVCVEVRAYASRVEIIVSDCGAGFDGTPPASRDQFAPGGRGVLFMRALTDSVEFRPSRAGGTDVVLRKRRAAVPA